MAGFLHIQFETSNTMLAIVLYYLSATITPIMDSENASYASSLVHINNNKNTNARSRDEKNREEGKKDIEKNERKKEQG